MSRPSHGEVAGPGQRQGCGDGRPAGTRSRSPVPHPPIVQGVLSLVLVVAIFYYLLTKIDLAQVWAAITAMTWQELATLALLAIWNLCTYALVWMSVTPGLGVLARDGDDPGDHRGGQHRARRVGHRDRHDLQHARVWGAQTRSRSSPTLL